MGCLVRVTVLSPQQLRPTSQKPFLGLNCPKCPCQGKSQVDLTNSCSFLLTGLMQGTVGERDKSRGEVWQEMQEAWWRIEEAKKLTVKVLSKCKGYLYMYIGVNTEPSPAHSLGYIRDQIEWADVIKRQGHYLSIYLSNCWNVITEDKFTLVFCSQAIGDGCWQLVQGESHWIG